MAVHMPSEFCFDWWHQIGGWDITYPHYDWYANDERMKSQIHIENSNIENFFDLNKISLYDVFEKLGLPSEFRNEDELFLDTKLKKLSENNDWKKVLNNTVSRCSTGIR